MAAVRWMSSYGVVAPILLSLFGGLYRCRHGRPAGFRACNQLARGLVPAGTTPVPPLECSCRACCIPSVVCVSVASSPAYLYTSRLCCRSARVGTDRRCVCCLCCVVFCACVCLALCLFCVCDLGRLVPIVPRLLRGTELVDEMTMHEHVPF